MSIDRKGPGDIKYGGGKSKNMKKMPDGNPYPYEMTHDAIDGIADGEVAEGKRSEKYSPTEPHFQGEDGKGGSGK